MENSKITKLREYLLGMNKEDFIKLEADTILDVEYFRIKNPQYIIYVGDYFLVDSIGNDISLAKLTTRKLRNPRGRLVNFKHIATIIDDCLSVYGDYINGIFRLPDLFEEK